MILPRHRRCAMYKVVVEAKTGPQATNTGGCRRGLNGQLAAAGKLSFKFALVLSRAQRGAGIHFLEPNSERAPTTLRRP